MADSLNSKALGFRIRKSRREKYMTQYALAEDVGISANFLGDIERGIKTPSLDTIIKITNCLEVSLDYLFFESLNNSKLAESDDIYVTDKQLKILKSVVKTIRDTFVE